MRTQSLLSALAVAAVVVAEDAPVITSNPIGAQYEVTLAPKGQWTVAGAVKISSGPAGTGVSVELALAGLPEVGGPFSYHIHEKPVPEDGNCTGTGAHLDPYKRGEDPVCDPKAPETCQTGDLAGKHGKWNTTTYSATYNDEYLSTQPGDVSYFGDLSIVVHLANKTRIACANFKQIGAGNGTSTTSSSASYGTGLPSGTPTGGHNGTASVTPTGSPITPTASPTGDATDAPAPGGAGNQLAISGAAILAFAAAMVL